VRTPRVQHRGSALCGAKRNKLRRTHHNTDGPSLKFAGSARVIPALRNSREGRPAEMINDADAQPCPPPKCPVTRVTSLPCRTDFTSKRCTLQLMLLQDAVVAVTEVSEIRTGRRGRRAPHIPEPHAAKPFMTIDWAGGSRRIFDRSRRRRTICWSRPGMAYARARSHTVAEDHLSEPHLRWNLPDAMRADSCGCFMRPTRMADQSFFCQRLTRQGTSAEAEGLPRPPSRTVRLTRLPCASAPVTHATRTTRSFTSWLMPRGAPTADCRRSTWVARSGPSAHRRRTRALGWSFATRKAVTSFGQTIS
jgi:hypothetical protein